MTCSMHVDAGPHRPTPPNNSFHLYTLNRDRALKCIGSGRLLPSRLGDIGDRADEPGGEMTGGETTADACGRERRRVGMLQVYVQLGDRPSRCAASSRQEASAVYVQKQSGFTNSF